MSERKIKLFQGPCEKMGVLEERVNTWLTQNNQGIEVIQFRQNASGGWFYVTIFYWDNRL